MSIAFGLITSLLGAVAGAYAVYRFALRQLIIKRRLEFREKQLVEFYSPAAAIAQNLRLRHDISDEILRVRDKVNPIDTTNEGTLSERTQRTIDSAKDLLRYAGDNLEKFKNELLPQYQQLARLFMERYGLADPDTRSYYASLVRYLEIYDRLARDTMTIEVATHLGHMTNSQRPLFDHLEAKVEELRGDILVNVSPQQ